MGYIVLAVFFLVAFIAFMERWLVDDQKKALFYAFAFILVLLPTFREVGVDPDSINYETAFAHYADKSMDMRMETSYMLISEVVHWFSNDVHSLFFVYALLGVMMKMVAVRKYHEMYFLSMLVYMSYIYEMQEFMQIRTGVLAACFLFALVQIAESRRFYAFLWLVLGCVFHISGLILFPFLVLNNKPMNIKQRWFWVSLIPLGYVFYVLGTNLLVNIPIPYIEAKLDAYENTRAHGGVEVSVNVFSPLFMLTMLLFLYLLYFHNTIVERFKYFPLLMKAFSLALFCYIALTFLPVMALRVSYLLRTVTILLFPCVAYTIKPHWAGIGVVALIAFIFLNYGILPTGVTLFWKG